MFQAPGGQGGVSRGLILLLQAPGGQGGVSRGLILVPGPWGSGWGFEGVNSFAPGPWGSGWGFEGVHSCSRPLGVRVGFQEGSFLLQAPGGQGVCVCVCVHVQMGVAFPIRGFHVPVIPGESDFF